MSQLAPTPFSRTLPHCRLCTMYIPRPAKLLFQHDDGWSRYLDKHGDSLSDWTKLAVERMLACGTCAMGVRRYCCASPDCTHSRFFCQSCKSKACSSCGLKATGRWITEQQHILPDCDWQHVTFTMPHLLWPFFNNNWPLLNNLFRCATRAMLRWASQQGIESVSSVRSIPTAGNSISTRISMSPSPAAASIANTAPGDSCSLKRKRFSKSGATPWFTCCATTTRKSTPVDCRASVISVMKSGGTVICMRNIAVPGECTLPKDARCLAQREIPRPVPEAPAGGRFSAAQLPRRCRGASVLRSPHAAAQTPENQPGGNAAALRQPYSSAAF